MISSQALVRPDRTRPDALLEHLRAEFESYGKLGDLLDEEQVALAGAQVERLTAISGRKLALYDRLQALAQGRAAFLAAAGIATEAGAIRAWTKRNLAYAPGVLAEWGRLRQLVRKTQQKNMQNGRLASALAQHFRSRLNLLAASQGANATATYGRDGSTRVIQFPGSIGQL